MGRVPAQCVQEPGSDPKHCREGTREDLNLLQSIKFQIAVHLGPCHLLNSYFCTNLSFYYSKYNFKASRNVSSIC